MSLIEDALRRVQDPVVTSTTPPAAGPVPTKTKPATQAAENPAARAAAHSWPLPAPRAARPLKARAVQEAPLLMAVLVLGLTGVLAVAAAFWMGRRLHPSLAAASAASLKPTTPSPSSNAAADVAVVQLAAPLPMPAFTLSGIVEGLGQPCAMINAAIVCLGERVAGSQATLVAMGERAVTLEQPDGSSVTLKLPR